MKTLSFQLLLEVETHQSIIWQTVIAVRDFAFEYFLISHYVVADEKNSGKRSGRRVAIQSFSKDESGLIIQKNVLVVNDELYVF